MICGVFYEGLEVGRCGREGGCAARGEDLCFTGRRNNVPVLEVVGQTSLNRSRTLCSLLLGYSDEGG